MTTSWRKIFGPLDEMAGVVADVLRVVEAAEPGGLHSQASVRDALAVRLGQLQPDQPRDTNREHAQNIVAHIHARWSRDAQLGANGGDPKRATVPDPIMPEPPWLREFTEEWRRRPDDGKWALFRR